MTEVLERVAERLSVTTPGVVIVRTPKEVAKSFFQGPDSNRPESIPNVKLPRRPAKKIQFGALRNRSLKVAVAIPVELDRRKDMVVARWDRICEFGCGSNASEALDDFAKTIEELFLSLSDRRSDLTDDLLDVLAVLESHIVRIPARG